MAPISATSQLAEFLFKYDLGCNTLIYGYIFAPGFSMAPKITSISGRGGFLFLGHSEILNGIDVDFKMVGSTVYQKA